MEEVFPVLAGVGVGLATYRLRAFWLKGVLVGTLGVVFGTIASWVSGELATSWIYLLIDTAQVVGVSVMTAVLAAVLRRRLPRMAR